MFKCLFCEGDIPGYMIRFNHLRVPFPLYHLYNQQQSGFCSAKHSLDYYQQHNTTLVAGDGDATQRIQRS
jgi:hypothetical protein